MRKFAFTAVLLPFLLMLAPGSASAAASCSRSTCQGRDPQAYGCSADAYTLVEMTFNRDRMEMRYSPKCGAAWNRCTTGNTVTVSNNAGILIYNSADTYLSKFTVFCSNAKAGDVRWTPMANFIGQFVRVCGKNYLLYGGEPEAGDWRGDGNAACTTRR